MAQTLHVCYNLCLKFFGQVRQRVEDSGGSLPDPEDDLICREVSHSPPFFRGTQIPGYSVFELQASSSFDCYGSVNETHSSWPDSETYSCDLLKVLFIVTWVLLSLAIIYEIIRIYVYPGTEGENSLQEDENSLQEDENTSQGDRNLTRRREDTTRGPNELEYTGRQERGTEIDETINILQISLVFLVYRAMATCKQKCILLFICTVVHLIPFLVYFIAFSVFTSKQEYKHRSALLGNSLFLIRVWLLDFILANALYVAGTVIFLRFINKHGLNDSTAQPCSRKGKRTKLACYCLVSVLCFFRFSATVLLLLEVLSLIVVGIAINISFVGPAWINIAAGCLVILNTTICFFDKYQNLFNEIYSVGTKVDKENLRHKILSQSNGNQPQTKFEISSRLLKDIIRKRLPLHLHFFKTVRHFIAIGMFLGFLAGIVIAIDRNTNIPVIVEYILTVVPMISLAAGKIKGNPCLANWKEKNLVQDHLYGLEEDLRQYARTGEI